MRNKALSCTGPERGRRRGRSGNTRGESVLGSDFQILVSYYMAITSFYGFPGNSILNCFCLLGAVGSLSGSEVLGSLAMPGNEFVALSYQVCTVVLRVISTPRYSFLNAIGSSNFTLKPVMGNLWIFLFTVTRSTNCSQFGEKCRHWKCSAKTLVMVN